MEKLLNQFVDAYCNFFGRFFGIFQAVVGHFADGDEGFVNALAVALMCMTVIAVIYLALWLEAVAEAAIFRALDNHQRKLRRQEVMRKFRARRRVYRELKRVEPAVDFYQDTTVA